MLYGPKYPVAVVYSPNGRDFICFEPMTGPDERLQPKAGRQVRRSADNTPWREMARKLLDSSIRLLKPATMEPRPKSGGRV